MLKTANTMGDNTLPSLTSPGQKTIYSGPFVHSLTPHELDVCTAGGAIGVDESGKIAFIERSVEDVEKLANEKGWADAQIVRIQGFGFFFPGFIGMHFQGLGWASSRHASFLRDHWRRSRPFTKFIELLSSSLLYSRYTYSCITISKCRFIRQINTLGLAQ
jgi:hypothetical protein